MTGFWGYETEHEPNRVNIYGRHDFHVPPLRPTKFEDWPKWERAPFELALTDQDFCAPKGTMKISAALDLLPVFRPADHVTPEIPETADLDFNVDA